MKIYYHIQADSPMISKHHEVMMKMVDVCHQGNVWWQPEAGGDVFGCATTDSAPALRKLLNDMPGVTAFRALGDPRPLDATEVSVLAFAGVKRGDTMHDAAEKLCAHLGEKPGHFLDPENEL